MWAGTCCNTATRWPQEGNEDIHNFIFHSGSSVSFCSFLLTGNETVSDQWSRAWLQSAAARLQWRGIFRQATCKCECEHRLQAWVNLNSTSKLFCFHLLLHLINSISLPLQRQHMLIPGRSPELLNNEQASGQCFSKYSNSNSAAFLGNLYSAKVINVISW